MVTLPGSYPTSTDARSLGGVIGSERVWTPKRAASLAFFRERLNVRFISIRTERIKMDILRRKWLMNRQQKCSCAALHLQSPCRGWRRCSRQQHLLRQGGRSGGWGDSAAGRVHVLGHGHEPLHGHARTDRAGLCAAGIGRGRLNLPSNGKRPSSPANSVTGGHLRRRTVSSLASIRPRPRTASPATR